MGLVRLTLGRGEQVASKVIQSSLADSTAPNFHSQPAMMINPKTYTSWITYYKLSLDKSEACIGWILPWVSRMMPWDAEKWIIDESDYST